VRTNEYQKRGLPHHHFLLFLDAEDRIDTKEKIDEIVCACLPSQEDEPELFDIVSRNMVHGPCGKINPKSPCMVKDKAGNMVCSKNFPKKLIEETVVPEDGYPTYRRTVHLHPSLLYSINHPTRRNEKFHITNEWVVPYNPYLGKKYKAVLFSSGHGLCSFFVTALMYGGVLHPKDLWIQFCGYICDDIQYKLDRLFPNREYMPDATESESDTSDQTFYENSPVLDYGLYLIQVEFENLNKSLSAFRMPFNKFDWAQRIDQQHADDAISSNAFLRMEQSHNVDAEESLYIERYSSFNDDQKAALDTIVSAVEDGEPQNFCFFLQGPAGTGKTFIYNTLYNYFCLKQMIVACIALSGIASLLLPNGRTSHFLFKIPLLIASDSTCSIRKNSELAEYL
jgi:hypothetical protein